jgi:hypothetical protein
MKLKVTFSRSLLSRNRIGVNSGQRTRYRLTGSQLTQWNSPHEKS